MIDQPDQASSDRDTGRPSRRALLAAGAGVLVGAATAPDAALAQPATASDPELARLQAARRVLIKGGVVLTLDRQVGDFARADVLIEDGKIREVRPDIAAGDDAAVIDAARRIVVPASSIRITISIKGSCATFFPTACSIPTTTATSRPP